MALGIPACDCGLAAVSRTLPAQHPGRRSSIQPQAKRVIPPELNHIAAGAIPPGTAHSDLLPFNPPENRPGSECCRTPRRGSFVVETRDSGYD